MIYHLNPAQYYTNRTYLTQWFNQDTLVITDNDFQNTYGIRNFNATNVYPKAYIVAGYAADIEDAVDDGIIFVGAAGNDSEKIDIGDLLSYRAFQIGGDYQDTYNKHLSNISGLQYNYIIHVFADSSIINDLLKKQSYDEIKIIQISGTNLGKISILKKN